MSVTKCFLGALVLALAVPTSGLAQSFYDDFEGATLDPFWTKHEQSGYITFPSTAQAHSPDQCLQLNSTYTYQVPKYISVTHTFAEPKYGCLSVWMYDTGADVASSNYIDFQAWNQDGSLTTQICVHDYDVHWENGKYFWYYVKHVGNVRTTIDRTQGWHHLTMEWLPGSLTLTIDGETVYTGTQDARFDGVRLQMRAPDWRPNWVCYFDDFAFEEHVENPFTVTAFEPPMGKRKKLGSTLPVKFQLFVDDDEMQTPEEIGQALGLTEPVCPRILIQEITGAGIELPDDGGNVGEGGDLGDCFRYSDGRWIFNLGLPESKFYSTREYEVTVDVGGIELEPENNQFEIK